MLLRPQESDHEFGEERAWETSTGVRPAFQIYYVQWTNIRGLGVG